MSHKTGKRSFAWDTSLWDIPWMWLNGGNTPLENVLDFTPTPFEEGGIF